MTLHTKYKYQHGVVLITTLILLVVLTMLAVTIIKSSVIDLKIGGANQIAAQNLASAEAEIMNFVNYENSNSQNWISPHTAADVTFADSNNIAISKVQIATVARGCDTPPGTMKGGGLYEVYQKITATATGILGGQAVVNQGVRALTVSCT